jgi:pimeloyl-ACP methyl ester carboxylesterase
MNVSARILSVSLLLGLLPPSLSNAQAPLPQAPSINFAPTTFTASAGEQVEAETGWLTVPEKRAKPQGGVIKLPVLRFKCTAKNSSYPLVYLAGGPGASGIESARQAIFPLLMALRERGDVIVFDQRGTGKAEPSLMLAGRLDLPANALLDAKVSRRHLAAKASEYAAQIRGRGIDLSAYNTNESADDVNDLRRALGAEKLVIWGHSYGSHLGLAVLKRHGQRVARAIFGGVNGPDQRWRYPNDLQALVERIDNRINEFPKLRRQLPSLKRLVAEVFEQLDKKPVTVQVQAKSVTIGKMEVQVITALLAGDLEFVSSLPLFFSQMRQGDFSRVAQLTLGALKQREADTAMRYAMHIASGVSPERAAKIEGLKNSALFGNAINFPFDQPEFLAAWGVADLGAEYRAPVKSDVPTLFLSGDLDGRTSIEDAEEVRRGFSRNQRVIIEGAAHDFYQLSPQVLVAMLAFLDGKAVEPRIALPVQFRGPDELRLIGELRKLANEKGAEATVKRLRELRATDSPVHISSYVAGTLGVGLWQQDKKPLEALEVFKAAVELHPNEVFLHERLADVAAVLGLKDLAIEHYRKCLALNSLNRAALLKLSRLNGQG